MSFARTECCADYSNSFAKVIVTRTQSDRTANATQSGSGRNLIGRRTQSDRAADANGAISTETINVFELIIGKEHLKNIEYNSTYSIHWHDVCDKQNTTKPFCQKLLLI